MENQAFSGCSYNAEFAWNWLYFWPLTNDSRTNLVALSKSLSIYLFSGPEVEVGTGVGAEAWAGIGVWAGTGVEVQKMAGIDLEVPLSSIGAPPALQRMQGPAI